MLNHPLSPVELSEKLSRKKPSNKNHITTHQTLTQRPRRNRKSPAIRELIQETRLHPSNFVVPLFVLEGDNTKEKIPSMPDVYRRSLDLTIKHVKKLVQLGLRTVDIFPVVPQEKKDPQGAEAIRPGNLMQQTVQALKSEIPDLCIMVDVALDPYTDHGHDGLINDQDEVINDPTLEILAQMSLLAAESGADVIAPSDMMDGRVATIRKTLDRNNFTDVSILSYTAKYASAFYGPFRDALGSSPKFGDKKSYQMNPANIREALLEASLDQAEGADMLLIKPAMPYLDVIAKVKEKTNLPVGAYQVSGEYAMIMAAAQNGWIDGPTAMLEALIAIKRAGADFIFTYAAQAVAEQFS